jgi:3-hydroxybutyryl-CoA dehydrogenase
MNLGRLKTVAVIGNGIIGHGIAQIFAAAGSRVVLIGRNQDSLDRAMKKIAASLDDFAAHGLIDRSSLPATLARIQTSLRLEDAAAAQLVIEAVTEDLPLKLDLFGKLDRICPLPAVLGSSSGQPASALIAKVANPERVIATHFWYPPQLIPLVEVCALQFAMLREAWALWASGAASAEAIDTVVRNSFGRRVGITGPIESADAGGSTPCIMSASHSCRIWIQTPSPRRPSPNSWRKAPMALQMAKVFTTGRSVMAPSAARMEELFRWLKADKAREH